MLIYPYAYGYPYGKKCFDRGIGGRITPSLATYSLRSVRPGLCKIAHAEPVGGNAAE
jgi:hypothetical protein